MSVTPRRRLTPEQRRAELLASAEQMVDEEGPDSLSLDLVAERSGCSRNLAYTYFPNRDALVTELQGRMRSRLGDRLRSELPRGAGPAAWIRSWGEVVFDEAEVHGGMLLLLFARDRLNPDDETRGMNLAVIALVADRLATEPAIGPDRARVLARLLLGMVISGVLAIAVDREPRARVAAEFGGVVDRLLATSAPH